MLIQVDFFKDTGKWYAGGMVEISFEAYEPANIIRTAIYQSQKIVNHPEEFHMVVDDIPESKVDPNYRTTYSRLYLCSR